MLFGGLSANSQFLDFFHGDTAGPWQAITSVIYQIGGLAALPVVGPCVDTWGRKAGMFIGATIIIVGCIVNGLTVLHPDSTGQLQAGRFVLGFGVSIVSAAGPIVCSLKTRDRRANAYDLFSMLLRRLIQHGALSSLPTAIPSGSLAPCCLVELSVAQ